MTFSEKIKTINKKIKQKKAQYNLDRQTAKIWTLSSGKVVKWEFLAGQDILPVKRLLEKDGTIKRFKYLLLGSEWKTKVTLKKIKWAF